MEIKCPISGKVIRKSVVGPQGCESRFLSEFQEFEIIGSGGFGCVVRCLNSFDQQFYAVKKVVLGGDEGLDFDSVIREVRYLAQFSDENIVRYYQVWVETEVAGKFEVEFEEESLDNRPCLYIQQELCSSCLKLPVENFWDIFKKVVKGLHAIHAKKIRHGDLKPANIFLVGEDGVKIGDFGLASCLEGVHIAEGVYVAPELKGDAPKFTLKSDIYSLGLILFEMLSNFNTESEKYKVLKDPEKRKEHIDKFPMNDLMKSVLHSMISDDYKTRPDTKMILEILEEADEELHVDDKVETLESDGFD